MQFYNQNENGYDSYAKLFTTSGNWFTGTSVQEMIKAGIPKEMIVIGKPALPKNAYNTGWVSATNLGTWYSQAKKSFGWDSGIFTWEYASDASGDFVKTVQKLSKGTASGDSITENEAFEESKGGENVEPVETITQET